jgi:XTP/dITP diphosphohydrolase
MPDPMKLVIATRNAHKLGEIRALLDQPDVQLLSALDFPDLPDVVEEGATFAENAVKKAVTLSAATGCWALGDDSGLEVDALGGAPGVFSARYAGEPTDYHANNQKLLRNLAGQTNRRARFVCALALSSPTGTHRRVEGECPGTILESPRGAGGFGYDPLFVPDGFQQSFAEMHPELKNAISHRGRALALARAAWRDLLAGNPAEWPV